MAQYIFTSKNYDPRPPSKLLSCGAEGPSALKKPEATGWRWLTDGCSRGPSPLWPTCHAQGHQGNTGFPAPCGHSCSLRLNAERRSGTSSVATAQLPQGKQAFGPQGHGTPQKEVTVRCGWVRVGESSGCPANAYTLAGRCGVTKAAGQGCQSERPRETHKYYMFSQGISRRQAQK